MIISCPSCGASFNIKTEALGPTGRTVKCSKCAHRWHATADGTPQDIASPVPEEAPGAPPEAAPSAPQPAAPAAEIAAPPSQEPGALAEQLASGNDEAAPGLPAAEATAAPVLSPGRRDAASAESDDEAASQDAGVRSRASRRPRPAGRKPRNRAAKVVSLFVLLLLISGVASVAIFMKQKVMMWLPATQRLYAMIGMEPEVLGRGLQIVEPKPKKEVDGNDQILVVEGEIRNVSSEPIEVPLMRGALLNKQGKELHIWTFTAAKSRIKPGESAQYRTEFRNPPTDAESLDITFTRSGLPVASAKPEPAAQDATAAKPQDH
jgi:predicted Zn finger-like uncharacterized protein